MKFNFFFIIFIILKFSASLFKKEDIEALNSGLSLVSDNLFVENTKSRGLGMFAKRNVTKGEVILKIPADIVYSTFDPYEKSENFYEKIDKSKIDYLAGRLLVEKFFKNNTMAHFYYNELSKETTLNGPVWSEEAYNEYVKRLGYAPVGLFNKENYKRRLDILIWKNMRAIKLKESIFPTDMFERKKVEVVYSQIYSHSIPISKSNFEKLKGITVKDQDKSGRAFIPYLDLFNYKRNEINLEASPSEIFDFEIEKNKRVLSRFGITSKSGHKIEFNEKGSFSRFPFSDYVIGKFSAETIWDHIDIKEGYLVLKSNQNYLVGEELRYQHAPLSVNEELTAHNFISIPNPYEGFVLQINSSIVNPDAIEICMTELDCINFDEKGLVNFRFNWFQVNHRFVHFIRISNLLASLKKEEIQKKIDGIVRFSVKDEFYNGYRELDVWKTYFQSIESFVGFPTSLKDDRIALLNVEPEGLKSKILRYGIYQKQTVYKHLIYSQRKWMGALQKKILGFNFKKMILATHDEALAKKLNPDLLTADDLTFLN